VDRNLFEDASFRLTALALGQLQAELRELCGRAERRLRDLLPGLEGLAKPHRDRRREVRAPAAGKAMVSPSEGGPEEPVLLVDRSAGGLSLWLGRPASPGEALVVRTGGTPILVEVCHCRPAGLGGWLVGCQALERREA
jgi:hypothetical protein